MTSVLNPRALRRQRRLNGFPVEFAGTELRWFERMAFHPWTWVYYGAIAFFTACAMLQYAISFRGKPPLTWQSPVITLTGMAGLTLAGFIVVYLVVDRWRSQGIGVMALSLGWGICVSTLISLILNTLAGSLINDNSGMSSRAAVYVAPFVEESSKASILFFLAFFARYRLVNSLSVVVLSGMSAAGFAFAENIIYYQRALDFSLANQNTGDPWEAVYQTWFLRGFLTCWGHPSFTMMTALGLAFALRSRSKTVRILAPVCGFLAAAFLHMMFNSSASHGSLASSLLMFAISGLLLVISWSASGILYWYFQGRLIRDRLIDYVRMGWAKPTDPKVFGRLGNRMRIRWLAAFEGWRVWLATKKLIAAQSELAYLRDAMTRGIVDEGGLIREKELFEQIRRLREIAIDDPSRKRSKVFGRKKLQIPPPRYPGPAGLSGHLPGPGQQPIPSSAGVAPQQHSPVNPTWGPPRG